MITTRSKNTTNGFSLIEVTIALAITAVGLVTLMGMLPQGMKTMDEATDQAIEARIHQQILSELQLTPYDGEGGGSPLDDFHHTERFYDSQGIELLDSQKGDFQHIYTARIHIPSVTGGAFPDSVGGSKYIGIKIPGGEDRNEFLRMVVVEITSLPYGTAGIDWSTSRKIHVYQTTIVKMGQDFSGNS